MKFSDLLLFAAGVSLLACAQAQQTLASAADANAPVAPLQYQSVFGDVAASKEAPQPPDKRWARANRVVLGEEAEAPISGEQSTAGVSQKVSTQEPMHGKHEHKGAHQ
ncbi:hypothetical protein ACL58G_22010 [Massilia sp. GER05]|uniref:hypothetical protein n=1 Tax=Massilia sp. GER05 TaxID=3394605 RepID=UPI003F829D1B